MEREREKERKRERKREPGHKGERVRDKKRDVYKHTCKVAYSREQWLLLLFFQSLLFFQQ